jgi:23S rRNA (cytosine1962-C5)-methyltransferase
MNHPTSTLILTPNNWQDYALLDSGNGLRLERFGPFRLVRPEAEAIWKPALPNSEWEKADATFIPSPEENGGHWAYKRSLPERWKMDYQGLTFWAKTSASRHLGVFPEQSPHWDWMQHQIRTAQQPVRVLNLFGYTGLASLAAAKAGAQVTHLDASRKAMTWGRENQNLSNLDSSPIRWIVDDALKFVQREIRRGSRYEGILLDPPKFGRGPKGEVWEFYKLLPILLENCRQVLSEQPVFVILTAYAVKASPITLHYAFQEMMSGLGGQISVGELTLREINAGRLLPTAIFARWSTTSVGESAQ